MIYNGLIADSGKESGKGEQEERTKPKGENKDGVEMEEFRLHKFLYILILHSYTWAMERLLLFWGRYIWRQVDLEGFLS